MTTGNEAEPLLVYITAANEEEAARIGRALVGEGLCACANVLGSVRSFYRWKGEVQDDREVALVAKTLAGRLDEVTARVRALHSYEIPCVVALPITGGNPEFLGWLAAEAGGRRD